MQITELLNKKITNIYELFDSELGGMDTAECFVELDGEIIIDIPWGDSQEVRIKDLDQKAKSLFADLSDIPFYSINKEGKSAKEIADKYKKEQQSIFSRIKNFILLGSTDVIREYIPYKTEYVENKLKHIKDKRIIDFIRFPDESEKGYLLLENGFLISETISAMQGTGSAGINLFENLSELTRRKGENFARLVT